VGYLLGFTEALDRYLFQHRAALLFAELGGDHGRVHIGGGDSVHLTLL
jgi:hypothetical protein